MKNQKIYKCLIVEDEDLLAGVLKSYLEHFEDLELVAICSNPIEAYKILKEQNIDLMFLDIEMPHMTGVDFLKSLDNPPFVIFTTAYSEYAVEGFDLNAIDYLLKPIKLDRFLVAVNKFFAIKSSAQNTIVSNNEESEPKIIILKCDGNWVRLQHDDIVFIEGLREYVRFHTVSAEKYIVLRSLISLEEELPESGFIRIHRSHIVNKKHVKSMSGNQVLLIDSKLSISNSYKTEFSKWFLKS